MKIDLPKVVGGFSTVVADPPWPYSGQGPVGTGGRGAAYVREFPHGGSECRYGKMSMQELALMPVESVVANNAHLYLWTTNSFVVQAHDLAKAWGFLPKTMITWAKVKKDGSGTASCKTGYYFRSATEHILFAVRGSLKLKTNKAFPTWFAHQRLPHSVKPEWVQTQIESKWSPGPYLELFARRRREGWICWGNEV